MKSRGSWKFIFVELVVVFLGVYLAFLLGRLQEAARTEREQKKVLTAIKYELEAFRLHMPGQADFTEDRIEEWNAYAETDSFPQYFTWRFLQPQYDYQILQYALQLENSEIIDLKLYENLSKIYNTMLVLEQAERRMTQFSDSYKPVPRELPKSSNEYKVLFTQAKVNFYKFRSAAYDQMGIKSRLGSLSAEVLELVDGYFDANELKTLEEEVINRFYSDWGAETDEEKNELIEEIKREFPRFSENEIASIIAQF